MITKQEYNLFSRTIALVGEKNFIKLKNSSVLIFGLGGVGSACVESLARCGINELFICDYDIIDTSNINRQVIAYNSTVGQKKVDITQNMIKDINPTCNVTSFDLKMGLDHLKMLADYKIDYIVDAIDSFEDKIAIIQYAKAKNIKIISAMGAGGKKNPLAFKVADYKDTKYCKLAKKLRKRLKELGIKELKVVYSEEESISDFTKHDFIPSIAFVPVVVGHIMASEVVKDLCHIGG